MRMTEAGLAMMRDIEHLELDAFQDEGGVWTIGYGRTRGVHKGLRITAKVAEQMFRNDVAAFARQVAARLPPGVTNDNEFSAMVSLTYNIGAPAYRTSTVLRLHLMGDHAGAGDAFRLFDKQHIDGVLVERPGLLARRNLERALYLS